MTYMTEFDVWRRGGSKRVRALRPESAVKKAFRAPEGWHWEQALDDERDTDAFVYDARTGQTLHFRLEDNG